MGYSAMSLIQAKCISECINRTTNDRVYPGQIITVAGEEYDRLLKAGCIAPILETCTTCADETACKRNPSSGRARKR